MDILPTAQIVKGIEEVSPVQHTQEQIGSLITPEVNPENSPQVIFPQQNDDDKKNQPAQQVTQPVQVKPVAPVKTVVTAPAKHQQLHTLTTTDTLTSIADLEETHFIEGVETAHEHA